MQHFQRFLNKTLSLENGAKECIVQISARAFQQGANSGGWSAHCSKHHPLQGSDVDELGKVDDDDDDDGERKDDDTDQPKGSNAGLFCAGIGDAVSTQKKAETAAPGRRQKASSGDKGAQKAKKARVAPKGK